MIYLVTILPSLVARMPVLLMWLAGIVLSVLMLRRGGGKAEKLLLAGCSVKFMEQIYGAFAPESVAYMMSEQFRAGQETPFTPGLLYQIFMWGGVALGLAGFVCLILAFWIKFRSSLRSGSKLDGGI
jgi:hypothetical protein